MRTLTVYVVRHADDAPMRVFPTMKAANEYLTFLRDEDPEICIHWHAESNTFNDNSTGVADAMSWLLNQCADELIAGIQNLRELEKQRGIVKILSSALAHHGITPELPTDLEIATPEAPERIH